MKFAFCALVALLVAAPVLVPGAAEAKSVKWACVNIDPLNPSTYVCYPVSRP